MNAAAVTHMALAINQTLNQPLPLRRFAVAMGQTNTVLNHKETIVRNFHRVSQG